MDFPVEAESNQPNQLIDLTARLPATWVDLFVDAAPLYIRIEDTLYKQRTACNYLPLISIANFLDFCWKMFWVASSLNFEYVL